MTSRKYSTVYTAVEIGEFKEKKLHFEGQILGTECEANPKGHSLDQSSPGHDGERISFFEGILCN